MPKNLDRVLLVRTDKLGDLILALPVGQAIKAAWPECRVSIMASTQYVSLLNLVSWVSAVLPHDSGRSMTHLARDIRVEKPQAALFLYPRPKIAWAAWRAGVPHRVGPVGRWYSFLFNARIRMHRSRMDQHEAHYNLELARSLGIPADLRRPQIDLTEALREQAVQRLGGMGTGSGQPLVILHPGSGGSSPPWTEKGFAELVESLVAEGCSVAVTAGPHEEKLAARIAGQRGTLINGLSLPQLAAVYSLAHVVVAGSTGPLHLASACGAPVVGLYGPARASTPARWGPLGPGRVLRAKKMQTSGTLENISVANVHRAVMGLLK